MTRESSPPEAIRSTGWGVALRLAVKRKTTLSSPRHAGPQSPAGPVHAAADGHLRRNRHGRFGPHRRRHGFEHRVGHAQLRQRGKDLFREACGGFFAGFVQAVGQCGRFLLGFVQRFFGRGDLLVPDTVFEVALTPLAELGRTGRDNVVFLFTANRSATPQPVDGRGA